MAETFAKGVDVFRSMNRDPDFDPQLVKTRAGREELARRYKARADALDLEVAALVHTNTRAAYDLIDRRDRLLQEAMLLTMVTRRPPSAQQS